MLDSLDIALCVCLEGMLTAEAEQQRLSGVVFTMMLLSLVSEEVYFPCLLFVELPLIECTQQCFEWDINKINGYECLWRHAWPFRDRNASRNIVAETVRCGWRFLSVFIVHGRLWQTKGNENHMNTAWKLVKESNVVWCGLHWTDLLWCPLLFCMKFSGQLTCRCTSWVSAKTFRHSFPASKGNR